MKVKSIKSLIEKYSIQELKEAETALIHQELLPIEIEGKDDGEQLTHILAAIYCKEEMDNTSITIHQAVRLYSRRVRNSIN